MSQTADLHLQQLRAALERLATFWEAAKDDMKLSVARRSISAEHADAIRIILQATTTGEQPLDSDRIEGVVLRALSNSMISELSRQRQLLDSQLQDMN